MDEDEDEIQELKLRVHILEEKLKEVQERTEAAILFLADWVDK